MSLYQVQKLLYNLNRDPEVQTRYHEDFSTLLDHYELEPDERKALESGDIGELYIMGVNGQLLMHYSALIGQQWDEYIQAMTDGLAKHGQVKAGIYASVSGGKEGAA